MRHFGKSVSIAHSILPQNIVADANGATVDLKGYESALVVFEYGAGTAGQTLSGSVYATAKVEESDNDSDWTAVAAGDLEGSLTVVDSDADASKAYAVGYTGSKRYIRAVIDVTGTFTSGIQASAVVIRANARVNPTTQGT